MIVTSRNYRPHSQDLQPGMYESICMHATPLAFSHELNFWRFDAQMLPAGESAALSHPVILRNLFIRSCRVHTCHKATASLYATVCSVVRQASSSENSADLQQPPEVCQLRRQFMIPTHCASFRSATSFMSMESCDELDLADRQQAAYFPDAVA